MLFVIAYILATVVAPFVLVALLLVAAARWLTRAFGLRVKHANPLRVLITGCDSGFGQILARKLARDGHVIVYAGCYTNAAVTAFSNGTHNQRMRPFQLDITDEGSVSYAHSFVSADLAVDGADLWAIVNNAGIRGKTGHPSWLVTADFEQTMQVNCMGQIRMTLKFLSSIQRSKGRIIIMGSLLGRVPSTITITYNTAKHAIYGFADTLRVEMAPRGVKVITLTPGFYPTDIVEAVPDLRRTFSLLPEDEKWLYPKDYIEKKANSIKSATSIFTGENSIDDVIRAYEDAVLSRFPKDNYWIGADAQLGRVLAHLPEIANNWQTALIRRIFGDPDGDLDFTRKGDRRDSKKSI